MKREQLLRPALMVGFLGALAGAGLAQQQLCYGDDVPLQPTNYVGQSVTVPRFDPDLGILTAVELTLEGTAQGSAQVESLDATATTVVTSFQATITLTRPDMTPLVAVTPAVQFNDDLTAFDGIIDFGGTSGITHPGIVAVASDSASAPPPASDLALFTGPAGNPGTITLPVEAIGTSNAAGPGNLITQFMTSAGAVVTVCYVYELDCNDNGIPDDDDISSGNSGDCNVNDIPDECEIYPGLLYCFGNGCPCANEDPLAGCANSSGAGALLTGTGSTSISADDLVFMVSNLIPSQPALLFSADEALNGCNGRAFGDGLRCAGINTRRLGTMTPDMNGDALYGPGLISLEDSPDPGDTRRYQVWYRDPNGPCGSGFNLTNGLSIAYTP